MSEIFNLVASRCFRFRYPVRLVGMILLLQMFGLTATGEATALFNEGIYLIPYPQQVNMAGEGFIFGREIGIVLDKNATEGDRFAAEELAAGIREEWGIIARTGHQFRLCRVLDVALLLSQDGISQMIVERWIVRTPLGRL